MSNHCCTLQDKLYTMELNKEMTKKYKKILKSMPSFTEQGWSEYDKWDITITGFRIYESTSGNRRFEIDIEYSGSFRWSWGSTRSKNNTVRSAAEKTLRRYFSYLGFEVRFNMSSSFYKDTAKIKKITRVNPNPNP